MEGQQHQHEVQDLTPACTGTLHLPVHMRDMDPHCSATEEDIQAVEMRYYRNILGISYLDHITNEQVRKTVQHHIGPQC